jgi:arylsulfatase
MWAPGRIPAGKTCDRLTATLDLMPTFAHLAGTQPPTDRIIDGQDISALLFGQTPAGPDDRVFYYYQHTQLQAVRQGRWKLHLPRPARPPWVGPLSTRKHIDEKDVFEIKQPLLYDLEADLGETRDVAAAHPDIVANLLKLAEAGRQDIGDYNLIGKGQRFFDDGPRRSTDAPWLTVGPAAR